MNLKSWQWTIAAIVGTGTIITSVINAIYEYGRYSAVHDIYHVLHGAVYIPEENDADDLK